MVVVAEGAGQDLLEREPTRHRRVRQRAARDIGRLPAATGSPTTSPRPACELNLKYIDPSYAIRSVPANPYDSVYCIRLAQAAVHAGDGRAAPRWWSAAGAAGSCTCRWPLAVSRRNQVDPRGDLWMSVLESTGQPVRFT